MHARWKKIGKRTSQTRARKSYKLQKREPVAADHKSDHRAYAIGSLF
jgi:hypothetical protein